MSVLRHFLLFYLAVFLVGCQTKLSGDYYDPVLAKHPFRLHLTRNGAYSFEQMYMAEARIERGRWWRVHGNVVMLVPDDTSKAHWFARVARKNAVLQLRHSTDVRDVLNETIP